VHVHALGPESPRIAHEAAHGLPAGDESAQYCTAEQAGGAREQDHSVKP